jgi:hypothetical protein
MATTRRVPRQWHGRRRPFLALSVCHAWLATGAPSPAWKRDGGRERPVERTRHAAEPSHESSSAQLRWFSSDHPPRILCTQPLTHVPRRNQPAGQCPDCASAMTGRPRTWSVLITTNRKRPHLGVGSERTVGSLMSWCRVWLLVTPKLRLQPRRPAATLRRPLGAAVQ